ncbi:MAG TPA: hypothetical protein VFQ82_00815 [Stellaceae bacterium]|jgi:hypothetical protein|nr:hypothetical protein [Stellaceae bacterium]
MRIVSALALGFLTAATPACAAEPPLALEARIALPDVHGRIDHMAVDVEHRRLLVAELGNDTLDVVDLAAGRPLRRIAGLAEPQGVGYAPAADLVAVADAADGRVRFFRGAEMAPAGILALGGDADDVRTDPRTGNLIVGYGSGGLAVIDPRSRSKIADIRLAGHPEAFEIDAATGRAFVNVPDAKEIAVVDLTAGKQVGHWEAPGLHANFPMALDLANGALAVVFRRPPTLVLIDKNSGAVRLRLDTCGDADDLYFDAQRRRIYVSCGSGVIDVFEADGAGYRPVAHVPTASGARTSLFVPQLDRLYVAARAGFLGPGAAILVFRPAP